MSYAYSGAEALNYLPCRYGASRLLFRGPRRRLDGAYVAALGSTETYGKFVARPWTDLLEDRLGLPVVNMGYPNAGVDAFVNEPGVTGACAAARVTVIQLMGAHNMSNRFYAVHPRRNDRFLRASSLMQTLFREVDFTEFHFTRHMLSALRARLPEKYAVLEAELQEAWLARMRLLMQKTQGKVVLLWMHGQPADRGDGLGAGPLMITPDMVQMLAPEATAVVEIRPSAQALAAGTEGMHFAPLDAPAAARLPGPLVHDEVAEGLAPVLRGLL